MLGIWAAAKPGYSDFIKTDPSVVTQDMFPKRELLAEFGPYFFCGGQAPWIMAYAITQKPETIGLWGIDPRGDYKPQRSEVQHFVQIARDRGIEVIAPEDDVLTPRPLYGYELDRGPWMDGPNGELAMRPENQLRVS